MDESKEPWRHNLQKQLLRIGLFLDGCGIITSLLLSKCIPYHYKHATIALLYIGNWTLITFLFVIFFYTVVNNLIAHYDVDLIDNARAPKPGSWIDVRRSITVVVTQLLSRLTIKISTDRLNSALPNIVKAQERWTVNLYIFCTKAGFNSAIKKACCGVHRCLVLLLLFFCVSRRVLVLKHVWVLLKQSSFSVLSYRQTVSTRQLIVATEVIRNDFNNMSKFCGDVVLNNNS